MIDNFHFLIHKFIWCVSSAWHLGTDDRIEQVQPFILVSWIGWSGRYSSPHQPIHQDLYFGSRYLDQLRGQVFQLIALLVPPSKTLDQGFNWWLNCILDGGLVGITTGSPIQMENWYFKIPEKVMLTCTYGSRSCISILLKYIVCFLLLTSNLRFKTP